MEGMPLYDYACKVSPSRGQSRSGQSLVTVHSLELLEWKGSDHPYR
jgi:tRNA pseudouridine55 synthase